MLGSLLRNSGSVANPFPLQQHTLHISSATMQAAADMEAQIYNVGCGVSIQRDCVLGASKVRLVSFADAPCGAEPALASACMQQMTLHSLHALLQKGP